MHEARATSLLVLVASYALTALAAWSVRGWYERTSEPEPLECHVVSDVSWRDDARRCEKLLHASMATSDTCLQSMRRLQDQLQHEGP